MGQRNFVQTREFDSPFEKGSLFHNYYDDPIGATFLEDETPTEDKFTYTIIPCESGLEVFEKYKSNQYQPSTRHIDIFVEKENTEKNNFFGTACRVKMGEERRELMWQLYNKETRISVHDSLNLANSLEQWAEDISYFSRNSDQAIDKIVLANAVKLELSNKTDAHKIYQTLFGLNNRLADWIRSGVEAMDDWKFTEENYDFEKYGEKLKPVIPVNLFNKGPDFLYTGNKDKITIKDSGINVLTQLSDNLDQIIFTKAYVLALSTPIVHDDILFGAVWLIKEWLEENLPESIKTLFNKVKTIISQAKQFIQKIGKELQKAVAVYNAFLCGLTNGLISLLQMIVWLVAFVIDNIPILELENFSKEKLFEHQEKLEFIEDLIDLVQENISEMFNGFLASFETLGEDIESFIKTVENKVKNLSRYWWAFIIGSVVFELIIDAVFAFFTGGTSLVGSTSAKITRLSAQLTKKGIKVAESTVKNIAASASSLYTSVKTFFREIIEVIKSGKFIEWIREQFLKLFEDSKGIYDNLISAIGKTERIQKSKSGIEVLCFVNRKARVPVDKILKYCRGKVKDVENYESIKKEFESLKKIKKRTPEQNQLFKKLQSDEHRISRSLTQKKILDDFDVPDNVEWNKKILDEISKKANKEFTTKYGGIGNKEVVEVVFDTPKGKIILETKWEKIDYAKFWMNTIIIKTLK